MIGWLLIGLAIVTILYGLNNLKVCPASINPGAACEQSNYNFGLFAIGGAVIGMAGCIMVIVGFIKPLLGR